jgi:hypothetical protein
LASECAPPKDSVLQRLRSHISQSSAPLLFAMNLLALAHSFEIFVSTRQLYLSRHASVH